MEEVLLDLPLPTDLIRYVIAPQMFSLSDMVHHKLDNIILKSYISGYSLRDLALALIKCCTCGRLPIFKKIYENWRDCYIKTIANFNNIISNELADSDEDDDLESHVFLPPCGLTLDNNSISIFFISVLSPDLKILQYLLSIIPRIKFDHAFMFSCIQNNQPHHFIYLYERQTQTQPCSAGDIGQIKTYIVYCIKYNNTYIYKYLLDCYVDILCAILGPNQISTKQQDSSFEEILIKLSSAHKHYDIEDMLIYTVKTGVALSSRLKTNIIKNILASTRDNCAEIAEELYAIWKCKLSQSVAYELLVNLNPLKNHKAIAFLKKYH